MRERGAPRKSRKTPDTPLIGVQTFNVTVYRKGKVKVQAFGPKWAAIQACHVLAQSDSIEHGIVYSKCWVRPADRSVKVKATVVVPYSGFGR